MMNETDIVDWPTEEGFWMAQLHGVDWFPLRTMALKDDLRESAAFGSVLAIVAQYPRAAKDWPYCFKGNHPVTKWRRPTLSELERIHHFYGLTCPPPNK